MSAEPIQLQTAKLVSGSESPIGVGQNDAMRCILALSDGTRRAAILKRIPHERVMAECFCALVLRGWGLNVPEPFLVEDQDGLAFGSADATYPSLSQRLGLEHLPDGAVKNALISEAVGIVASLAQTPLALMADEAIDNRDRNLQNILWDGKIEAWIDHELALGLAADYANVNKLAIMACATPQMEAIKTSSLAAWMSIDRSVVSAAGDASDCKSFAELVAHRLNGLGAKILARFPQPFDLLSPQ